MPEYAWLLASTIGLILVLTLARLIFKKSPAPDEMGRTYIRQQLQKRKIANADVSDNCISELVEIAISSAEIEKAAGNNFRKSFTMLLDSMIDVILLWRSNPEDMMFQPIGDEISMFREIMERNNVAVLLGSKESVAG
ncbi:MAG: hypothetical protein JXA04_07595 [Gammaproteobacteria bacterium]|nr:hypothetical protein [Gammaproteobacteria bacterium]